MIQRFLMLLLAWTLCPAATPGQNKTAKPEAGREASSLASLILGGKVADSVKLAEKNAEGAQAAYKELLDKVDLDITDRRIPDADSTLSAMAKFLDAYARSKKAVKLPQEPLKGRQLRLQGIRLSDDNEYAKAESVLKEALEVSKKSGDRALEAGVRNNLGYALRHQQKLEEAASQFDTARKMAEEQKDMLRASSYNFNLGEVLLQTGPPEQAIDAFRRSADQSKAAARSNLEARAILMQGVAQGRIDSMGPAPMGYYEKAQKMFEAQGDYRNAGWSYYLMANHTAYTQKFADAAAFGEKAVPLLEKAKDEGGLKAAYFLLYDMYNRLNDRARSEKYKKLWDELPN